MKKTLSIIFLFAIIFTACKRNDYAALIEQERRDIKQYIKDNGINVYTYSNGVFSNNLKKDTVCNFVTDEKWYYLLGEDSIYFCINTVGNTTQPVKLYDRVQIRYIETTLDNTRTESYWTTLDLPYPIEVIFGDIPPAGSELTSANCAGWQAAIRMMKYSETEAEIIVPSKLGLYRNYNSITPCHYRFYFKVLPK